MKKLIMFMFVVMIASSFGAAVIKPNEGEFSNPIIKKEQGPDPMSLS